MEFVQEIKDYCHDKEEEDEEEEEEEEVVMGAGLTTAGNKLPFSSSSEYKGSGYEEHQRLWLGTFQSEGHREASSRSYDRAHDATAVTDFNYLSVQLRNNDDEDDVVVEADGGESSTIDHQREHMFDKVVTPSDVGKLNRLVIPKQHAEKYFPLDSTTNEKGLLLNFEDRNGKPWRFRYSYWNSSQSYVMTKGWSRFVKEKKLDAGDIVSFERSIGVVVEDEHHHSSSSGKEYRLYIDWRRRRPDVVPAVDPNTSFLHPNHHRLPFPQSSSSSSVRWGSRLYSLPLSLPSMSTIPRDHHEHLQQQQQQLNYSNFHPYIHHHQQRQRISYSSSGPHHHHDDYNVVNSGTTTGSGSGSGSGSLYYLRSSSASHHNIGAVVQQGGDVPMVIDSVPVVHGNTSNNTTAAKRRLRLFGVNMECPIPDDDPAERDVLSSTTVPHVTMASLSPHHLLSASSISPLQLRLYNGAPLPTVPAEYPKRGKASLSFDLDL